MTTFWPKRDEDGRHMSEPKPLSELLAKLDPNVVDRAMADVDNELRVRRMKKLEDESSHLIMGLMDVPRYILELRDEVKSLRAEVELLKPNKPKCGKCGEYKESYTHFSMATGMTNMHWICLNNECQE